MTRALRFRRLSTDRAASRCDGGPDRGRAIGDRRDRTGLRGDPYAGFACLMAIHPIVAERKLEALRHALGPVVLAALVEPAVVEVAGMKGEHYRLRRLA